MFKSLERSMTAALVLAGAACFLSGCDEGEPGVNTPDIKETSAMAPATQTPPAVAPAHPDEEGDDHADHDHADHDHADHDHADHDHADHDHADHDHDAIDPVHSLSNLAEGGPQPEVNLTQEEMRAKIEEARKNQPKAVDPETFPVKITPAKVDLGEIPTGETGSGTVTLVNTGTEPVLLSQCKTSCGCTTTNCPRGKLLQPNEEVEVEVRLKGGTVARPLSKNVTFIFDEDKKIDVEVFGRAVAFVDVEPRMLDPEGATEGTLTVKSLDGTPFRITKMQPPILEPEQFSTEPQTEHQVLLNWDRWAELGNTRKLTFYLDHPKADRVMGTVKYYPTANVKNAVDGKAQLANNAERQRIVNPAANVERLIAQGSSAEVLAQLDSGDITLQTADRSGTQLLSLAAKHGNVELVEALLERGADINATDQVGRTALMIAARSKSPQTIEALLEHGASVSQRDMVTGASALSWAAGFGDAKSVQALIGAGSDLEVAGPPTGFTPLIWASGFGDPGSVEALIEAGADLEAVDTTHGATPLMHASRTGGADKIGILLQAGAKLEARDATGKTPLLVAAEASASTPDMIDALLSAGADLNAVDDRGRNALDLVKTRTDPRADKVQAALENAMGVSSGEKTEEQPAE